MTTILLVLSGTVYLDILVILAVKKLIGYCTSCLLVLYTRPMHLVS